MFVSCSKVIIISRKTYYEQRSIPMHPSAYARMEYCTTFFNRQPYSAVKTNTSPPVCGTCLKLKLARSAERPYRQAPLQCSRQHPRFLEAHDEFCAPSTLCIYYSTTTHPDKTHTPSEHRAARSTPAFCAAEIDKPIHSAASTGSSHAHRDNGSKSIGNSRLGEAISSKRKGKTQNAKKKKRGLKPICCWPAWGVIGHYYNVECRDRVVASQHHNQRHRTGP